MEKHSSNQQLISSDTSSKILRELAYSDDKQTRCQVAQHPNTPPDVLKRLFGHYPVEVLTNPIMELLLLENPNFLEELCDSLSFEEFISNLILYKLPLFFREWGLNNPRLDISLKFDCLIHIPREWLEIIYRTDPYSRYAFRGLVGNENTPPNILEKLSLYPDRWVRRAVAMNKNTPVKILSQLSLDNNEYVRIQVAINKNTPANILEKLSLDEVYLVRQAVPISLTQNAIAKARSFTAYMFDTGVKYLL